MQEDYNNYKNQFNSSKESRLLSYKQAQISVEEGSKDLGKWKDDQLIQKEITDKLFNIRKTLGLDPNNVKFQQFIRSPEESERYQLQNNERNFQDTFGKSKEVRYQVAETQMFDLNTYNNSIQTQGPEKITNISINPQYINSINPQAQEKLENSILDQYIIKTHQDYSEDKSDLQSEKNEDLERQLFKKQKTNIESSQKIVKNNSISKSFHHDKNSLKNSEKLPQNHDFYGNLLKKSEIVQQSYKTEQNQEIENLQIMINELQFEVLSHKNTEKYLKQQITQQQQNSLQIEEGYKKEILDLKEEILYYQQTREIFKNSGDQELKNFVIQLETSLSMSRTQLKQLAEDKTNLEMRQEQTENNYKQILQKLHKQLDEQYKKEIKELKDFICNIQTENLGLVLNKQKQEKGNLQKYIQISQNLNQKLKEKEDQAFTLENKIEWLEQQLHNDQFPSNPDRRIFNIKNQLIFYKEKSELLVLTSLQTIEQLRKDNKKLKQTLISSQKKFFEECENFINQINNISQAQAQAQQQKSQLINVSHPKIGKKNIQLNAIKKKTG